MAKKSWDLKIDELCAIAKLNVTAALMDLKRLEADFPASAPVNRRKGLADILARLKRADDANDEIIKAMT